MATATAIPEVEETELFKQSYSISIPKTMDGVTKVFSNSDGSLNEKALIYTVRAGLKQVINNRLRQLATGKDEKGNPSFAVVDGTYDATPLILQAPQRQVLSQREKLEKNLKACNMPEAVIAQMLTTFDQNVGTDTAEAGDTAVDTNEFVVVLGGKEGKQLIMRTPRSSDEEEE
jgi:hypothetical protein